MVGLALQQARQPLCPWQSGATMTKVFIPSAWSVPSASMRFSIAGAGFKDLSHSVIGRGYGEPDFYIR